MWSPTLRARRLRCGVIPAASAVLMVEVGRQAGLFEAMAELPPATSLAIAERAGLTERYVREWLGAMVCGDMTPTRRRNHREGVLRLNDIKTELFFVTLDKSEGFSPTVSYRDYAISRDHFHWETQN